MAEIIYLVRNLRKGVAAKFGIFFMPSLVPVAVKKRQLGLKGLWTSAIVIFVSVCQHIFDRVLEAFHLRSLL